jgi:hypothetical protein
MGVHTTTMQNFIKITTEYSWSLGRWQLGHWSLGHLVTWLKTFLGMHTTIIQNFITIGSVVYEHIEDKQTNKQTNTHVFFIYIDR